MVTVDEETQAKEFLKRAEIRTMKKDLQALREVDALKERDKIAKIKTLEEQLGEKNKNGLNIPIPVKTIGPKGYLERDEIQGVLQRNENQERLAEKELKDYATEQERQQIFLFESQRLALEKQVDAIDKEKDPALKLEKNKLLLQKRDQQVKLNSILAQEKKLEGEQKVIAEKEQSTNIPSERKGLEKARWDLDKRIQDVERKRWEAEKQIQDTDNGMSQIDKSSERLVIEKNGLRDKILGIDKSLRDIYFIVMAREEEKRKGKAQEQVVRKEELSAARAEQKEKIQREQWGGLVAPKKKDFLKTAPEGNAAMLRENMAKSFEAEEKAREKFIKDVEEGTNQNK